MTYSLYDTELLIVIAAFSVVDCHNCTYHQYIMLINYTVYIINIMIIYGLKGHWGPTLPSQNFSILLYSMWALYWSIFRSFVTESFRLVLDLARCHLSLVSASSCFIIWSSVLHRPYIWLSHSSILLLCDNIWSFKLKYTLWVLKVRLKY